MIDEVLFMQMRLFRLFCERTGLSSREGNARTDYPIAS